MAAPDDAGRAGMADRGVALHAVRALCEANRTLAAALSACLTRLDDLGEGDTPTALGARDALRKAGL